MKSDTGQSSFVQQMDDEILLLEMTVCRVVERLSFTATALAFVLFNDARRLNGIGLKNQAFHSSALMFSFNYVYKL